ncbi:hypothetical protein ACFL6B_05420 [Thermodesulfobacteriota bacterium]
MILNIRLILSKTPGVHNHPPPDEPPPPPPELDPGGEEDEEMAEAEGPG